MKGRVGVKHKEMVLFFFVFFWGGVRDVYGSSSGHGKSGFAAWFDSASDSRENCLLSSVGWLQSGQLGSAIHRKIMCCQVVDGCSLGSLGQ